MGATGGSARQIYAFLANERTPSEQPWAEVMARIRRADKALIRRKREDLGFPADLATVEAVRRYFKRWAKRDGLHVGRCYRCAMNMVPPIIQRITLFAGMLQFPLLKRSYCRRIIVILLQVIEVAVG